ncbi:zinc ribbon domain-containing protein [Salipaludibacillus daqingensis]|uniref:zinc ribbon domain-containing protein n=1 Tax=Salipaludibacillus daqingensis TaxID=3041001 RepID=UPI0024761067|nr:zinc ribbon domain-containing protein [Salipaludibacillus daqingensis]
MNCSKCGHELSPNDKFCMKCGHPVKTEEETAATTVDSAEQTVVVQPEQTNKQSSNEYVEKSKETAINYWNFVKANLMAPTQRGLANTNNDFIYAYINIAIYGIFFGLGTYFQARATPLSFFGGEISFGSTFFSMFFYSVASLMIGAVLVFGVSKFLLKMDQLSFHDVLARFGAIMTVPVALSGLYFLAAIPGLHTFLGFVSLLLLAGIHIALILTLFSFRDQAKATFDPIYALFIVFIGYAIFIALTADIFIQHFIGGLLPF